MDRLCRKWFTFIFLAFIAGPACQSEKWKPLFDGKSLQGWHVLPGGNWKVVDGMLVGASAASEGRHGLLVSDSSFSDFEIRLKFLIEKGNSGLYFRVKEVPVIEAVEGFQAEIETNEDAASGGMDTGGLYEANGRQWVVKPPPADVKKWNRPGQWNEMSVRAKGRSVVVHLNGFKTAEIHNDPGRTDGHIALQLHGGQDMLISFKDIDIKILN